MSWGFDNEIFYSTIYHTKVPPELQIIGPDSKRLLPSGLVLATVTGNNHLAETLLEADYNKYPPLRKVINNLRENYKKHSNDAGQKDNLYDNWINATALQWANNVSIPDETKVKK